MELHPQSLLNLSPSSLSNPPLQSLLVTDPETGMPRLFSNPLFVADGHFLSAHAVREVENLHDYKQVCNVEEEPGSPRGSGSSAHGDSEPEHHYQQEKKKKTKLREKKRMNGHDRAKGRESHDDEPNG